MLIQGTAERRSVSAASTPTSRNRNEKVNGIDERAVQETNTT